MTAKQIKEFAIDYLFDKYEVNGIFFKEEEHHPETNGYPSIKFEPVKYNPDLLGIWFYINQDDEICVNVAQKGVVYKRCLWEHLEP